IVSDGWSMRIFLREVVAAYLSLGGDRRAALPELPLQYADYAVWQKAWLSGSVLEQQLAYWRVALGDAPAALDLPTDRLRPPRPSYAGARVRVHIGRELVTRMEDLGRRCGATLFMVALAALDVVLARWSGQSDIVVGTPVANRRHAETESLIG